MDKQQAKIRIEKLKKEINRHRYLYHVYDKQEISDAASDSLKNELFKLEMEHPEFITPDSPTQRVGGKPLDKFKKVKHSAPMMSLFDAFSREDMRDWEKRMERIMPGQRFDYFCELKLDGLAAALVYARGKFSLGATRGDGAIGEDVTQNLRTVEAIPLALRRPEESELVKIGLPKPARNKFYAALDKGTIEARGEAIMTKKVFNELNQKYKKEGKPLLANPRNAAAGSIRQLDSKLTAARKLDCYVYSLITDLGLERHEQELELAAVLGFKVLKYNKYCKNLEEVLAFHGEWEKNREKLPFHCDGVAVKINQLSLWPRLGTVGKGPRYIMAYKFSAEQAVTKVKEVVWQVGRTGCLTPTATLEPVAVGGVTISRATLHNMDEIERLGLKINDTVIIERAGDVIPKVIKVLPKLREGGEKNIKPPADCPICGGKVVKAPGEVAYRCVNKNCYAVNLRRLTHWASRKAADIPGLGPKIIEQLAREGLARDISDFYKLTEGDLKPLERFADKSADNLTKAIAAKKEIDLARFIYGLGIRYAGEKTALLLAKQITNYKLQITNKSKIPPAAHRAEGQAIAEIIKYYQELKVDELERVEDVGPIVAKSIYDWFHNKYNLALLDRLEKNGVTIKPLEWRGKPQILAGKTFVLTGTLESLTRDEAKDKIRKLGGDVSSSVSKNTDFTVAGAEPGSKHDKARKLGVKIVGEKEFLEMIK
ncbi:NAD-dependent DNA ligase LigA [Patescibacteria group bacterium]|nr:NAD-dependent DNA ligase LigA [Patescibacteria group bacterium]